MFNIKWYEEALKLSDQQINGIRINTALSTNTLYPCEFSLLNCDNFVDLYLRSHRSE